MHTNHSRPETKASPVEHVRTSSRGPQRRHLAPTSRHVTPTAGIRMPLKMWHLDHPRGLRCSRSGASCRLGTGDDIGRRGGVLNDLDELMKECSAQMAGKDGHVSSLRSMVPSRVGKAVRTCFMRESGRLSRRCLYVSIGTRGRRLDRVV